MSTLNEYVVDRMRHPRYGVLTWEREQGKDIIRRDGKTAQIADGVGIATVWKKLKATAKPNVEGAPYSKVKEGTDDQFNLDSETNQRKVEPLGHSTAYDWVSNFDIREIQEAIQKIVEYLPEVAEDSEQTHLLRNDVRMLDNLMSALKSRKPTAIAAAWDVCSTNGAADHLHDEFAEKMSDSSSSASNKNESFANSIKSSKHVFTSLTEWKQRVSDQLGHHLKESDGFSDAYHPITGALVGSWANGVGWLYEGYDDFGSDDDFEPENVESEFVSHLASQLASGQIDYAEFKRLLAQAEQTNFSMRQGEMGLTDGDTPAGHRAWGREQSDWNDFDDDEGRWDDADGDGWGDDDDDQPPRRTESFRRPSRHHMTEDAPRGQEQWITANKDDFIRRYGEKRGTEILYATAWQRHNKTAQK